MNTFSTRFLALALALCILGVAIVAAAVSARESAPLAGHETAVGAAGELRVPQLDYAAAWPLLGSWSIADGSEAGGAAELHAVYAQPGVIEAFRRDGAFPDGSVLVKEVRSAATAEMTTGRVSRADRLIGWFVMVKDSQDRFAGNPLWGEGWGWAYFDAADPLTPVTEDFRAECVACHEPARDRDWIYTEGYPVLGAATAGTAGSLPARMRQ